MNTMMMVRIGLCSTGRITTRSRTTPPTKEIATVRKKANQYGMPALIMVQAI